VIVISFWNIQPDSTDKGIKFIDDPVKIEVGGHSGKGKKGEDIVCAGISALSQTIITAITSVAGIDQKITQDDGYLSSVFTVKNSGEEKKLIVRALIETLILGMVEIRNAYPERVNINFYTT